MIPRYSRGITFFTPLFTQLNQRYGHEIVAVFSVSKNKPWTMRRENKSPCYTTKWQDVPIANAH
ncbi:DUF4113 domain-containing protein [Nitrosomonas communis]|uniref:DUF4113 domain-containing protein n=1 Tax=Nitrosomonas communis TaxID=44574 RepID=UPI0009F56F9B